MTTGIVYLLATRAGLDVNGQATGILVILMFVAPFGIVGLAKQMGRRLVQVVPRPPRAASPSPTTQPQETPA